MLAITQAHRPCMRRAQWCAGRSAGTAFIRRSLCTAKSGAVAEIGQALRQESDLIEGHAASVAGRRLALEADLVA
jgi:hypothetical protein